MKSGFARSTNSPSPAMKGVTLASKSVAGVQQARLDAPRAEPVGRGRQQAVLAARLEDPVAHRADGHVR